MMFYILFLFLILCERTKCLKSRLYFKNTLTQASYVNLDHDTILQAESGNHVIINIPLDKPFHIFKYNCSLPHVLNKNFYITEAELCHTDYIGKYNNCYNVTKAASIQIGRKKFDVKFNKSSGFIVSTKSEWNQFKEGYYFCRLQNKFESVQSNLFKIYVNDSSDTENLKKKIEHLFKRMELPETLHQRKILHCGYQNEPKEAVIKCPTFIGSINWIACDLKSFQMSKCLQEPKNQIKIERNKDYYQFCNSSIVLSENYYQKHKASVVTCIVKNVGIYAQYIVDSDNNDLNPKSGQVRNDHQVNKVEFQEGYNYGIFNKLTAIYDEKIIHYHWKKDDFDVLKNYRSNSHELIFPIKIMPYHEGRYTLTVTTENDKKIYFIFEVIVIGPPKWKNRNVYPNIVYMMEGSSKSIDLWIEGVKLNTSVRVNQQEINTTSSKTILQGISHLKSSFDHLGNFQMSLRVVKHQSYIRIYFDIVCPQILPENMDDYNTLDVVVRNEVGEARVRVIIQFIEKPQWRLTLGQSSYDNSFKTKNPHYYRCAIYSKRYREMGILIKQEWKINELNITKFYRRKNWPIDFTERNDFLIFSQDRFLSGSDFNFEINNSANMTLSCSVSLLHPQLESDGDSDFHILYASDNDPLVTSLLQTKFSREIEKFFYKKRTFLTYIWWILLSFISTISASVTLFLLYCGELKPTFYESKTNVLRTSYSFNRPSKTRGPNRSYMSEISSIYNITIEALNQRIHQKDTDLEFTQSKETNNQIYFDVSSTNSSSEYYMSSSPIEVDAFSDRQQLIKINKLNPFKINCRVSELKEEFKISEAYLCRKSSTTSGPICSNVIDNNKIVFDDIAFDVAFDKLKGFTASLDHAKSQYLYGYFYCELKNNIDRIISNNIEIHDFSYYYKVIANAHEPIEGAIKRDFKDGSVFDCGVTTPDNKVEIPSWLTPSLAEPFIWFVCDNEDLCMQPMNSVFQENEHFQTFSNYSVQVFENVFNTKSHFFLHCINDKSKIFATYEVSNHSPKRHWLVDEIVSFTPKMNDVEMRAQNLIKNDYRLSVAYISNGTSFAWRKDGELLAAEFQQDRHSLVFPRTVVEGHAGTYSLDVYQRSPPLTNTFKFRVKVAAPPRIAPGCDMAPVSYIMSKQSLTLTTAFEGRLSSSGLAINEVPISTEGQAQLQRDLDLFKAKYSYLTAMTLTVAKTRRNGTTKFAYRAGHIDGLWFKKGFSHRITFSAANELGSLKESTLVKVIEPPRWKKTLDRYNCTDFCYSSQPHYFKCSIYSKEYLDLGLQVRYNWKINDLDIDTLYSSQLRKLYFEFSDGMLVIKNIFTDDHARDLRIIDEFRNATLACSVKLLAPKNAVAGAMQYREIFDSASDPSLSPLLQTKINMISDYALRDSSNFLVLMISIPLIVVVVVATVLVCVCYIGRGGKTYDIDQEERNAGKDPEKEMFEGLYFKQYHREEESDRVMTQDAISWSQGSLEDGLKSDIGEIESYESGNENFDEGSIIGQYGLKMPAAS